MSASWRVGGSDLNTGTVTVNVVPNNLGSTQAIRKQVEPRVHALPVQHNLGQDLVKWSLKFSFVGPAPDRHAALYALKTYLLANDPFTLQAPDSPNEVYFNNGVKTLSLSLDSHATDYLTGLEECVLTVNCSEA